MARTPEEPQDSSLVREPVEELLALSGEPAKAAQSEEYKCVLDHLPIAIVVSRLSGNEQQIAYVNSAFAGLGGFKLEDVVRKPWSVLDDFRHEQHAGLGLGHAILAGEDFLGTFRRAGDGTAAVLHAYVSCIENEDGSEKFRIAALVDVTAHDAAQREAIEARVREKDLLLRELQHRVKNNLQLIVALIRLEARTAERGGEIDLDRLAGRIASLALLYQAMAATDKFGHEVDLGPYLTEIASAAVRTHAAAKIELDLKVSYCPVSVNVAMPVGLLVNELITNAFKHAFPRGEGKIGLECRRFADDRFEVVVADDGEGLPPGETWPPPGKLGVLILQTLRENTKDADLKIDTARGRGTRVRILFAHDAPKPN